MNTFLIQIQKHLRLWLLAGVGVLCLMTGLSHAALWVNDPALCPATEETQYPGQNCSPVTICGDNDGIAQCYDTTTITAPASSNSSATLHTNSFGGGYLLDCFATQDSSAPYCDNNGDAWCNRDASCYTNGRLTDCTPNTWESFSCGTCRTGYNDCNGTGDGSDGDCEIQDGASCGSHAIYDGCDGASGNCICSNNYFDCDATGGATGNGCEVQQGGSCTVGSLSGSWSCTSGSGSCTNGAGTNYDCTCIVDKQYFETGTDTGYGSTDPLLWGTQFGSGDLINFGTDTTDDLFRVTNDGSIALAQISAPADTTDQLYNIAGTLYWNGFALTTSTDTTIADGLTCTANQYIQRNATNTAWVCGDDLNTQLSDTDISNFGYIKTDTNAGTECEDGEYLDGDGVCYAITSLQDGFEANTDSNIDSLSMTLSANTLTTTVTEETDTVSDTIDFFWNNIGNAGSVYLDYKPNNTECTANQVLKWNATDDQWICADDAGASGGGDNWGTQSVTTNATLTGDGTAGAPLSTYYEVSNKKTTDYTAKIDDFMVLCDATSNDVTITLPAASTMSNRVLVVKRTDNSTSNTCDIAPDTGETIDESTTNRYLIGQYVSIELLSDGTQWWIK